VRVLESAGLARRRIDGRAHKFRIEPSALAKADEWLRFYERFWTEKLDALESLLKAENKAYSSSPDNNTSSRKDKDNGRRKH
jgi:hypothetical protein